ncbi:uncharacterized protein N7515_007917 [Penicillium bovifimosum]|uniref:HNH nuclease domain-containing protein n=1 Tax=Penicillium bovifimosum TaxID=126998 RepID=A0A9W9KX04_9EURO|nr:uncharacterized protein N7515_007917 [Penicillium bovifimosum]KAJ5124092.1 hypothetical protein N7515_007917 [Penicillium bovifimosum]
MLDIVLVIVSQSPVAPRPFTVRARSGQIISRTSQPLTPGDYDIYVSDGDSIKLSDEAFMRRLLSYSISGREVDFQNGVRARDGNRWITDADSGDHSAPIHSIQNGFLLKAGIHQLFDDYSISVNPDDNYKITSFIPDAEGVDGRTLDLVCRNPADPHRVSDDLLGWHFRQSVLANMRGGWRAFV